MWKPTIIAASLGLAVAIAAVPAAAQTAAEPVATSTGRPAVSPELLKDLAPGGRLRAAINLGNAVLAQGTSAEPRGVSVDLARELARRTGLPLDLVVFEAAGKVVEAQKSGAWDIAFMAREPARATEIAFSSPYVLIEGTYMVAKTSPLQSVEDVDKPGNRIAVGLGSAYDLYLTRTVKNATLVRAQTGGGRAMIDLFLAEKLEAVAGVRQALAAYAKTDPNVRLMDGRFQVIEQTMAVPRGRAAAAAYVQAFIEEMKASGFIAEALKRSGQGDATIAPPG